MARLIDADQFKAKLLSLMDSKAPTPSTTDCILDGVLNLLEEQPTIDPLKHGRWILFWSISTGDCFVCSECGGRVVLAYTWKTSFKSPADKYRYCPHCGTRMDGMEE